MAWYKGLARRLGNRWMDYLAYEPPTLMHTLSDSAEATDVAQEMAHEQLSADALHLVLNRIRARLGVEDEIEDSHHDTSERLAAEDRYLLWAPVVQAMLKEIDDIRAAVWFGGEK
jgi:hypothetical protein